MIQPVFLEAAADINVNNNGPKMGALFIIAMALLITASAAVLALPLLQKRKNKASDADCKGAVSPYKRFSKVWLIIIASTAALLLCGICVLYTALREYESVQPVYEAQRVYAELFENPDADTLFEYVSFEKNEYYSETDAKAYLAELIEQNGPETEFHQVIGTDSEEKLYAVSIGDYSLGTFSIVKDEAGTTKLWKFEKRRLGQISVSVKPVYGVSVFAPECADVYVNGVKLDESCAVGDKVVLDSAAYFPTDDDSLRNMINYTVTGLYGKPEVAVTSQNSVTLSLVYDETSKTYSAVSGQPGGEVTYPLEYDEDGNCSAENGYVSYLADAYNAAVAEEENRQYQEKLKAEEEAKAKAEEEERLRLEAEEKQRLEEEAAFILSEQLRAIYEERVITIAKEYNHFFYVQNTDAHRYEIAPYLQPGTNLYYNLTTPTTAMVGSYTNWTAFNPLTFEFSEISTDSYVWDNEEHTSFTCNMHLKLTMYGYNSEIKEYLTAVADFDAPMQICVSTDARGLLMSSTVPNQ